MWINIFVGVATITNPLESSKNMPLFVCSTTMYRYLLFCILVNGANQSFGRIQKIYVHLSAYITMASMRLLICFFSGLSFCCFIYMLWYEMRFVCSWNELAAVSTKYNNHHIFMCILYIARKCVSVCVCVSTLT